MGSVIMEERAIFRDLKIRRMGRVLMYAGLAVSGVLATIFPSKLVSDEVTHVVATIWAVCMIVSALICLYGAVTDRWIGEYTGLPLLASVLALYGGSALAASDSESLPLLAYGILVLSFAFGLSSRWKDVSEIKKASGMEFHRGE